MKQQVDKPVRQSFKKNIDILKKEADTKRTKLIAKPEGTIYEVVYVHVTKDGQWCNGRNIAADWHTMLVKVDGRWMPIAQTILQNYRTSTRWHPELHSCIRPPLMPCCIS